MKTFFSLCLILIAIKGPAQLINKKYQDSYQQKRELTDQEMRATGNTITIEVKVLYNAIPDGYHITYTKSFIGKSVQEVEGEISKRMEELAQAIKHMGIGKKDMVVDIISLDPIFSMNTADSSSTLPSGFKVTENITFNLKNMSAIRGLSEECMKFGIYDLINAEAYINNSSPIYDSLAGKAVEILKRKKELATKIGWDFSHGEVSFQKYKEVMYPNERYLRTYIANNSFYKHSPSQNSTLNLERKVDVDNYFNFNLKDADFVFHSNETSPVIQFYYALDYTYTKTDTEAEMREKMKKQLEEKQEKIFYIIDKKGNLKKIEM